MGLAVVVVVDGERADVVTAAGRERDGVAVFFAGGEREEAEGLLLREAEVERLGDDGGGSAGVETVGEPCGIERIGGVGGAAAVNVVRSVIWERESNGEEEEEEEEEGEGRHGGSGGVSWT